MIPKPHALVTIVCPLDLERLAEAEAEIDRLGNPAIELGAAFDALDRDGLNGTHFASLHAIASTDGATAYVLLELSADGSCEEALLRLSRSTPISEALRRVFIMASDWRDGNDLLAYLKKHLLTVGHGFGDSPGLLFVGAPGLTVGRIRLEADLAKFISGLLGQQNDDVSALTRLARIRTALAQDPRFAAVLEAGDSEARFTAASPFSAAVAVFLAAVFAYLWPLGVFVLMCALGSGLLRAASAQGLEAISLEAMGKALGQGLLDGLAWGAVAATVVAVVSLVVGYLVFRAKEQLDSTDDRAADHRINTAMFERENTLAQNHMISVTRRKPGIIRAFTTRLTFLVVSTLAGRLYRPGFLSEIGTIHFARWVTPRGGRDLIFLSNYDGSWESYLEDFITLAHQGLTAVWSNTMTFPRTENLIDKGATDGERFKRFARRSMVPTRFWYSAYPELTVAVIRRNRTIREGLSGAMTEDEAKDWLSLFGSVFRPVSKLMSSEIQSLVFGGMKFMPNGICLVFESLGENPEAAKRGLRSLLPLVAFNDGKLLDRPAVVTLALGAGGLRRLGLPDEALDTFPFAFLEGMTTPSRQRILGDVGASDPDHWRWGKSPADLALLVYGVSQKAVNSLVVIIKREALSVGMTHPHAIDLRALTPDKTEAFGFLDGVSQPVIRGTYKGLRNADPIHLVEPGEFLLGYPDNRGNVSPGPKLHAIEDPDNLLPLVNRATGFDTSRVDDVRDLGFNGSFLVIRELEQDHDAFQTFCRDEAEQLSGRLPAPYIVDEDFIAAKLIGRWKDGASLVRHPYESPKGERPSARTHEMIRPKGKAQKGESQIDQPAEPRYTRDNDFLFGTEDPEGLRCPFGAHVRRANPRDSFTPGSADQIAISNRHRIMRVGRRYKPSAGAKEGLLFMCLNGDIERQFEFLQQTWLHNRSFHGLSGETDPVVGNGEEGSSHFTIPSRSGPVSLSPLPRFVTTKGGGYFFLPGKRLLEYLSKSI